MPDSVLVKHKSFLTSASSADNAPSAICSEIVFLGRSNVGKSSLINALLGENLAKSSSTPGKTQLINFYTSVWQRGEMKVPLHLIDMPGFGYAKVSKAVKAKWEKHLLRFLFTRPSIKLFIHLFDARHTDLAIDREVGAILDSICTGDKQMLKIYTKADKLNQKSLNALKIKHCLLFSTMPHKSREICTLAHLKELILSHALGECGAFNGL